MHVGHRTSAAAGRDSAFVRHINWLQANPAFNVVGLASRWLIEVEGDKRLPKMFFDSAHYNVIYCYYYFLDEYESNHQMWGPSASPSKSTSDLLYCSRFTLFFYR